MKRIKEMFLDNLESLVSLKGASVLEIGCGEGGRSVEIAQRCRALTAIEPNPESIKVAQSREIQNATFSQGSAENLNYAPESFDAVIFTLSFHHVPKEQMTTAIDEAIRVVKADGTIVFLEPAMDGSFFEAEIKFDACDGDEREEKASAYKAMMSHSGLILIKEIPDETVFQFDSLADFIDSMEPKRNIEALTGFLLDHDYILRAERRINIFKPRKQ
jgi:ubiquinone/menaquinone biosynthesis C-methylase UbiE